ncbi:MAG: type II secretion system ATPase GspE [Pseudomonadota bacterium]|nr:type II secretion system ATPase GspE [Pseudomonadota bacterium]
MDGIKNLEAGIPLISYRFAKRQGVLALGSEGERPRVVFRPNCPLSALVEVRRYLNREFDLEPVTAKAFTALLAKSFETKTGMASQMAEGLGEELGLQHLISTLPKAADLLDSQDDAPIIRLINALLSESIKMLASDIHIEPFEDRLLVRVRIDGVLREMLELPQALAALVISRIKVMAKLDIAEKRLPQDGRITLRIAGRPIDVRVSTIPASHGERLVLRLLDKKSENLQLSELGMSPDLLNGMQRLISIPHGIILVTGPTGSGKTTSLYAALTDLNLPDRNILTVEDPIEYDLQGIGQMQVNTKIDMSFAKGLRAILRQDPDIVMVGEIRDLETATIAVQASLTGHLVLSTLHTNSAIGAITRLRDMGVESFLISASLIGIVAQRLVRLLCKNCRKPSTATLKECEVLGINPANPPTIYENVGCDLCNNTGYSGRTGIYEIIQVDEKLRTQIHEDASQQEMNLYVRKSIPSIREDGCKRILAGDTTISEVVRVTSG